MARKRVDNKPRIGWWTSGGRADVGGVKAFVPGRAAEFVDPGTGVVWVVRESAARAGDGEGKFGMVEVVVDGVVVVRVPRRLMKRLVLAMEVWTTKYARANDADRGRGGGGWGVGDGGGCEPGVGAGETGDGGEELGEDGEDGDAD